MKQIVVEYIKSIHELCNKNPDETIDLFWDIMSILEENNIVSWEWGYKDECNGDYDIMLFDNFDYFLSKDYLHYYFIRVL